MTETGPFVSARSTNGFAAWLWSPGTHAAITAAQRHALRAFVYGWVETPPLHRETPRRVPWDER